MAIGFNVNDLIKHPEAPEWGVGRVIEIKDNSYVTIVFAKHGKTTLALADASWDLIKLEHTLESSIRYHKEFLEERKVPYRGVRMRDKEKKKRATHCYECHSPLDSDIDAECNICGWMLCYCGACGCGHPLYGEKYTKEIIRAEKATVRIPSTTQDAGPVIEHFDTFKDATLFARRYPGSVVMSTGAIWSVQLSDKKM